MVVGERGGPCRRASRRGPFLRLLDVYDELEYPVCRTKASALETVLAKADLFIHLEQVGFRLGLRIFVRLLLTSRFLEKYSARTFQRADGHRLQTTVYKFDYGHGS
jgi:hypothetical protein